MIFGGVCIGLNFFLVTYGGATWLRLLGVCFGSLQGGIGEATILALSQFYSNSKSCLVAWSSGTGFAGPGGYILSIFIFAKTPDLVNLIVGEILAVLYVLVFFFMLEPPWIDSVRTGVA